MNFKNQSWCFVHHITIAWEQKLIKLLLAAPGN